MCKYSGVRYLVNETKNQETRILRSSRMRAYMYLSLSKQTPRSRLTKVKRRKRKFKKLKKKRNDKSVSRLSRLSVRRTQIRDTHRHARCKHTVVDSARESISGGCAEDPTN